MGGRRFTWALLIVGVFGWLIYPNLFDPLTLDNMDWFLNVTGFGAAITGLALGRFPVGKERE